MANANNNNLGSVTSMWEELIHTKVDKSEFAMNCEHEIKEMCHQVDLVVHEKNLAWHKQLSSATQQLQVHQQEVQTQRAIIQSKEKELSHLRSQIESMDEAQKAIATEHERQVKMLKTQVTELQIQINDLEQSKRKIAGDYDKAVQELRGEVANMKKDYDRLQKKCIKHSRDANREKTSARSTSEADELREQVKNLMQKSSELSNHANNLEKQCEKMQRENKSLKDHKDALQKENRDLHADNKKLLSQVEQEETRVQQQVLGLVQQHLQDTGQPGEQVEAQRLLMKTRERDSEETAHTSKKLRHERTDDPHKKLKHVRYQDTEERPQENSRTIRLFLSSMAAELESHMTTVTKDILQEPSSYASSFLNNQLMELQKFEEELDRTCEQKAKEIM